MILFMAQHPLAHAKDHRAMPPSEQLEGPLVLVRDKAKAQSQNRIAVHTSARP
jgi:hypothetical protein